ncbi:MAG TPA: ribonuclease P protein component [Pseudacidobacterium sp.]|jgi:ribonuclease P protein component|nr:ribonuclease P protein component [Pseudacidobacterium sp.]
MLEHASEPTLRTMRGARLRKHSDYQHVYQQSRKHFSASMTYFFCARHDAQTENSQHGPRVGLTAGRVLGKAVERNRIKRRMREAVRLNLEHLQADVDLVLHPRKSVLEMDFSRLKSEVADIFAKVEASAHRGQRP